VRQTVNAAFDVTERKHAEDALRRAHEELEQRVMERTSQLTAINAELIQEITERERAEEALRRSEAYLAEGQRLSHTGSGSWNVVTGEVFWSQETYRIYGVDPGQTQPSYDVFFGIVHPEERLFLEQAFERVVRDRSDYDVEFRIIRPDGRVRHIHSVDHPVFDEAGHVTEVVGTVVDVTERKRAEEALQKAQAELAHVTRVMTMGELVAAIAHEVNQPLAAMVTNGEACLRWLARAVPDLEEARAAMERIVLDGHRAGDVITQIRALVKKRDAETARLDVNAIIHDVIALTSAELSQREIRLQTALAADLPPVLGDWVQLQQVMMNLILNAKEAMDGAGWQPRALCITSRANESGEAVVAVRDSGTGLDSRNGERIFDAFFTTKAEGLGLSISRTIIEAHGGRLWATANDGPGTTLQFTLPIGRTHA
jgi:PAS domain S-box-containing protein